MPRPPDLDEYGNPIQVSNRPPDLDDYGNPVDEGVDVAPEKTGLPAAWDYINKPLWEAPSRNLREVGEKFVTDTPTFFEPTGQGGWRDAAAKAEAMYKGFVGGTVGGVGDLVSGFTSPANLALMGLTAGTSASASAGLPTVARGLQLAARGAGALTSAHGAGEVYQGAMEGDIPRAGFGLLEVAGGLDPFATPRIPKPGVRGVIPDNLGAVDDVFDFDVEGQPRRPAAPVVKPPPEPVQAPFDFDRIPPSTEQLTLPGIDLPPGQTIPSQPYNVEPQLPPIRPTIRPEVTQSITAPVSGEGFPEGFFDRMAPEPPLAIPEPEPPLGIEQIQQAYRNGQITRENALAMIEQEVTKTQGGALARAAELPEMPEPVDEPMFAKVGEGKAKIDVNVKRAADELTSGYSNPLPAIMVREGLQNSIDVTRPMGGAGLNKVKIDPKGIEISDNGRGMSQDELFTVYTNLHETGKVGEGSATGGKGVGKAPFMLGGSHFTVETVKNIGGTKWKSSFSGTPEQLLRPFDVKSEVVPADTPTGTRFRTEFKEGQYSFEAKQMFDKMLRWSRDIPGRLELGRTEGLSDTYQFRSKKNDKSIAKQVIDDNDVELLVPKDNETGPRRSVDIHYLNNGMYQFSNYMHLSDEVQGMPKDLVVDVHPLVEEGSPNYPFPLQRESIKDNIRNKVEKFIEEKFVNPLASQKKTDLVKLWNGMPILGKSKAGKEIVFFDPGNRLTPVELEEFITNPTINAVTDQIDTIVNDILVASGKADWQSKVVRIGITLSPDMYGVHVPDPASGGTKSAILINPFAHMQGKTPRNAAIDTVVTGLHEVAHVGSSNPTTLPPISIADLDDPRVGRYLQTYMQQVLDQGGLDLGHGMNFIHRLGELYAQYGTRNGLNAASRIESIIADPKTGGYRPEIQRLLHTYSESRGRPAVTEDILSGTGVKSKNVGTGTGNIPGDVGPVGDRTARLMNVPEGKVIKVRQQSATPEAMKEVQQAGYRFLGQDKEGNFRFQKVGGSVDAPILESEVGQQRATKGALGPKTDIKKSYIPAEIFNLTRALKASMDFSAPLRQGLLFVHKKEFWTALKPMMQAWASEEGFRASQDAIAKRALFRKRPNPKNPLKPLPSFADDAGLKLTDLTDLTSREEAIMSTWAEKVPGVRRSNRAYTAFLNNLRADVFESVIKDYSVFDANAKANVPLARNLAEMTNIMTGRGSLGRLEGAAVALNTALFSPRLIASRLQMLNPVYYIMAPPPVRMEAMKGLLAVAAMGNTLGMLAKMSGLGEYNLSDPSSSDFGKIKIGDVRLDPWGGFQQYLVAANRLLNPIGPATGAEGTTPFSRGQMITSSQTEQEYNLWEPDPGPYDPNWASAAGRFIRGKMHPTLGFAWSLASGRKDITGKPLQFDTSDRPFPDAAMDNSIVQQFIPIVLEDLYELSKDPTMRPELKAVLGGAAMFGMSTQNYNADEQDFFAAQ